MAKFIKEFYDFMSFLEGKNIATKRPPERIDAAVYFVTVDVFNHYLDHYVKNRKISAFLENFKRRKDIPLTGGKGDLPADYAYPRVIFKADGKTRIDLIEDAFWTNRANRTIGGPSDNRPIARIDFTKDPTPVKKLEVLPTTLTTCELNYFKTPTKPKYAYTIPEGTTRYDYDDTNSVDMEVSIMLYPDMIHRVLSAIGVNLRESQLFQYMEVYKSQEQRK